MEVWSSDEFTFFAKNIGIISKKFMKVFQISLPSVCRSNIYYWFDISCNILSYISVFINKTMVLYIKYESHYKNYLELKKTTLYQPIHLFYWRYVSHATLYILSSHFIICKVLLLQAYFPQVSLKLPRANSYWQYLNIAMKQWNNPYYIETLQKYSIWAGVH